MTFEQWFLLYLISLSACNNRQMYDRLNVANLQPESVRGEAFYNTKGNYRNFIQLAEQGMLCPIYVWSLQFDYLKKWNEDKKQRHMLYDLEEELEQ